MDMVEILNPGQYARREPHVTDALRRIEGKLPWFSEYGAYLILYVTRDNSVLCAACATTAVDNPDDYDPVIAYDAYWEGDDMACDDCGHNIESAYGPVEETTP